MDEYSEITKWHPHLVLLSEQPVTWHGLMGVNNKKMEIKLIVPDYPHLTDAILRFGRRISRVHNPRFSKHITDLLHNATSVSSLLRQLQIILECYMENKQENTYEKFGIFNNHVLQELKVALEIPDIIFSSNTDMSAVKLTYKEISITLKKGKIGHNSWALVASDLPELEAWQPLNKSIPTLNDASKELRKRVDLLQATWEDLSNIDTYCWVIDPMVPKPSHVYRRIYLNPSLSLLITMDPLNPSALPDMKLLGSDNQVIKYTEIMNENLLTWSDENSTIENLELLLNMSELPKRPTEEVKKNEDAIVDDGDCCICFSFELDDGEIPAEICNNEKCRRHFHTQCLYQWLESVAGNQDAFDRIHGICPNCREGISCPIVSNRQKKANKLM